VIKIALTGLYARKLRTILTSTAIVLGVAMVSGSYVLTDTISKAFDSIFTASYAQTDAVVTGKKLVDYSSGGNATVSDATVRRIRSLPDVVAAAGSIIDLSNGGDSTHARIVGKDGKPLDSNGNPAFGIGVDPSYPRFNPLTLVSGAWAHGPGQVVVDEETATAAGFRVGDAIRVSANGPIQTYRLTGIARFGDVSTLGGATFAVWDIPTARAALGSKGYTAVSVAAKSGVSDARLVRELRSVAPSTVVRTGDEQAKEDIQGISGFIRFIRYVLLGAGGLALLVGSFVIFNTLSITVAQRTRELGTLRTIGASKRQVRRIVMVEGLMLGLLASGLGIAAGIGLARGLSALLDALGVGLPSSSPVYAAHTFVTAIAAGVIVTMLASLVPARRATKVPPIAAVRDGLAPAARGRTGVVVGTVLLVAGVGLLTQALVIGDISKPRSLISLLVGTVLAIAGVAGVASRLVRGLVTIVGSPARRFGGVAGGLASRNATRTPARTASTAAALMIGITLVSFVAVLGKGVHDSFTNAVRDQFAADVVITSTDGWTPFTTKVDSPLRSVRGVTAVSSIRTDEALVDTAQATVSGVDAATLDGMFRFAWKDGSSDATLASLRRDGVIVKQSFGKGHHLGLGDRFTLTTPTGKRVRLTVRGVYQPPRFAEVTGGIVVSQSTFDRTFDRPQNAYTLVRGTASVAQLQRALQAYPDAKVQTRDAFVKSQSSFVGQISNILYVLLALSIVVSIFGLINTLALSMFERTRELGMLRAVGLSRRQTRRMVRHESIITALIGAGLGLPIGTLLAAGVVHALGKYGVQFSLPVWSLVRFTLLAVSCGTLAAIMPARRAARLNVLQALQYE
jgi:putative ABC transport system permease protein